MNFVNHLESWLEDAKTRSNSIVITKIDEVEKELELRLHLHEPRMKRAEMDIHNVRAVELLIHEERVDRHCAGIEEVIENMQKQYEELQESLKEMAEKNKIEINNLEILFNNANKSIRLMALNEQLRRHKDKYIEDIKTKLRNFRAKIDETLSMLRNSNAKFRFSFKSEFIVTFLPGFHPFFGITLNSILFLVDFRTAETSVVKRLTRTRRNWRKCRSQSTRTRRACSRRWRSSRRSIWTRRSSS